MQPATPPPRVIVFYDGTCGLCALSVQWCLRHDPAGRLWFAPLQGSTAAAFIGPIHEDSIVVLGPQGPKLRSDAVLQIWRELGGPWRLLAGLGRIVPRGLRDRLYRFVAARRKRWIPEACALPGTLPASRFLP